MAGSQKFDRDRFEELVLYVAWKTRDDESFGRTKLAKTLFYCDFAYYAEEGEALTGAQYEHWRFGPFPPALQHLESQLQSDGRAMVVNYPVSGTNLETNKLVLANGENEPAMTHFPDWHAWLRGFVDQWIAKITAVPATEISEASHQHPGWRLTTNREEIPYHTVFMSRRRPTDADLRRGEELALQHGWP